MTFMSTRDFGLYTPSRKESNLSSRREKSSDLVVVFLDRLKFVCILYEGISELVFLSEKKFGMLYGNHINIVIRNKSVCRSRVHGNSKDGITW
jgi:hypothetical protein